MTYEYRGIQHVATMYGVGGWPGVGLVFDLHVLTAGLGAVGAFKNLQNYTQMGGEVLQALLDGKNPCPSVGGYQLKG